MTCDADVVDTAAFRERIERELSSIEGRTHEEKAAAFERRKALSGLGGVAELQSVEGDYMTLNIFRDSPVLDFAEIRDLPLGAIPFFRTRYTTPIAFYPGSVNAMGNTVYWATNDVGTQVTPFTFTSDEVMVPNLNAIYDMAKLAQRTEALKRLARDMKIAYTNIVLNTMLLNSSSVNVITDDPAVSLVNYFAGAGSTYFNGLNVYVLDPGVVATGVPTTNAFDLSGSEIGLTKAVFQTINDYRIQFGLSVSRIYVPNAPGTSGLPMWRGLQNSAAIVALTTGQGNQNPQKAVTPAKWQDLEDQNWGAAQVTDNWFGQSFDMVRQNWMPANYVLVQFNAPSCVVWDRLNLATGEDRAGTLEVPINGYMSRRSEAREIATARPAYCLKHFMVIKTT